MPFTPFHLGLSLLVAVLTLRYLDPVTLLLGSIAVDVRATVVFFGLYGGPIHGVFHTLVGSIGIGMLIGGIGLWLQRWTGPCFEDLNIDVADGAVPAVLGGLTGAVFLHLLPDALILSDVGLLTPFSRLLYTPVMEAWIMYGLCVIAGIAGLCLLIWRLDEDIREAPWLDKQ